MHGQKVITLLGILALLTLLLPLAAVPATSARQDARDKIEALVLEEIALQGQTDFFIWLTEKADLSPADQLQTKEEKGRFVYETLRATAERTQRPLRAYLDAQGVDYQAFYIANKVLVRGGGEALLLAVAARTDVAQITANHQYQMEELISPRPSARVSGAHPQAIEPNLIFVNADDVWAMGITGQGTVLAGNDTGLYITHTAIARHYRGCLDPPDCTVWDHNYNWWDATGTFPDYPDDDHVHGTLITCPMVGDDGGENQVGIAPGAQTIHCKASDSRAIGSDATIIECFQWDLAPWDLSGANPRPDLAPDAIDSASSGYKYGNNPVFRDEIQALHAAGIIVVVPAANRGPECMTLNSISDIWEVVTAGGVDHAYAFPGLLWSNSSRGPSRLDPTPPHYFPDVMAPSVNVKGCMPDGGYQSASGTSFAAPHVAGLVGLLWSACPNLRGMVDTTIQLIVDTAVPLTGQFGSNCGGDYVEGPNNDWGHGTIDALAAVQAALALCGGIGSLDGHVYDATTALPIAGATVENRSGLVGGLWRGQTDASGYYTITTLAGSYTVTASAYGYYSATVGGVDVITGLVTTQDFNLTARPAYLISGTVTEEGTGAPLSATVTVLETPLGPAQTDPATGFYTLTVAEGRYTLRVEAWGHDREDRLIVVDGDQSQDFALEALPCILLVDDDISPDNLPDVRSYYTSTLDHLGYDYDIYDVYRKSGPTFAQMDGYGMVIWFSGDVRSLTYFGEAGPNRVDEMHLATYLDSGGTLFLSSQDYLYVMGLTAFGQDYLGISSYNEVYRIDPVGTPGDPIGDGLGPFTLTPPPGWQAFYTDNVDGVQASPFRWQGTGQNNSTSTISDTFRTVFFAWPLEGIADLDDRSEVLWRVIDWLGGCGCRQPVQGADLAWTPLTPTVSLPVTFTGTALPWTATTPISFSWAFGDGTVGTAGSPLLFREGEQGGRSVITHTYAAAGTYSVTLTATNCAGVATAAHTLTVVQQPCQPLTGVEIAGPAGLGVGETGLYTATATPPTATLPVTITWDNGSSGPTAAYSWTLPSSYTLTVTATNPCGQASGTSTVTVCDPVAVLSLTAAISGCLVDFSAVLTGTTPFAYDWDFGPFGSSSAPTPTVDFSSDGTYAYTLTAYNCDGVNWDSFAGEVTVSCGITCAPVTDTQFTWTPLTPTVGQVVTFTGSASGTAPISFTWDFGDGTIGTAGSPLLFREEGRLPSAGWGGSVITHSYAMTGTYAVTLTATNCLTVSETVVQTIVVVPIPPPEYRIYLPLIVREW